jgi:hypothetical protein
LLGSTVLLEGPFVNQKTYRRRDDGQREQGKTSPRVCPGSFGGLGQLSAHGSPLGSSHSMVHSGQATTGGPRERSIRRRMPANRARGTSTSASWNTWYRPRRTIRAPIFDQLLAHGRERPLRDRVGQREAAQEIGQVVGQREGLQAHRVAPEGPAGQPGPAQRLLAFLT